MDPQTQDPQNSSQIPMAPAAPSAAVVKPPVPDGNHPAEESVLSKTAAPASQDVPLKISIILPTNAYFVAGIRDFAMTVTRNMTGFSEQWAYRFQSVVDELTNNAIEFGSAAGESVKITFVSVKNKYIEVFVEDSGTGKKKMSAADMMQYLEDHKKLDPTKITSIRGRGLSQIVSSWADSVEFTNNEKGGLTAHVIKNFDPNEQL